MKNIVCYFDGATEPINPGGSMGIGCCAMIDKKIIYQHSGFVEAKPENSNNVAEYMALVHILEYLKSAGYDADNTIIYGDSMLVIKQMTGKWKIKEGRYVEHARKSLTLIRQFRKVPLFFWIPREKNFLADELSKAEMIKNKVQFKIQPC